MYKSGLLQAYIWAFMLSPSWSFVRASARQQGAMASDAYFDLILGRWVYVSLYCYSEDSRVRSKLAGKRSILSLVTEEL